MEPLVSIIIPTYNDRRYVCDAVDSALAQIYPHCEIIVVDDGSTDGTANLLQERYGDQIRLICQENQGAAVARNTGLHAAQGEYIQLCDADDRLLPEKIARSLAVFQAQPETALVYTRYQPLESDGRTFVPVVIEPPPPDKLFCELLQVNFVPHGTVLARRNVVLAVGGYNPELPPAEDWDLWLRLAAAGHRFAWVDEVLMLYRLRPGSLHTNTIRMSESRLKIVQLARHYPCRNDCMNDAAYDRFEAGRHHQLAMVYWQAGRRADARHSFRTALALDPSLQRRINMLLAHLFPARIVLWIDGLVTRVRGQA
ncbi:MAG: glycosyltransferase [Chloroflexi bacterium]|nr:glycosyltransferase [Chloroflexota bacterium]